MITTYDFIDSNKRKTVLLVLLFPLSLAILMFVALYFYSSITSSVDSVLNPQINNNIDAFYVLEAYWFYILLSIVISMVWTYVTFYYGNDIILNYIDATEPEENEYKATKKIIENVSITAGIKAPKLYIMKRERNLNAFAVGTSVENSCIVLTYGIIEKLEKSELEAVIAHEISHIIHQDTKLMMTIILITGFFTFLGSLLMKGFYSRRGGSIGKIGGKAKGGAGVIIVIGFVIYIYGNFVAPLIRFAVSRTREFQADANAALLTRNPQKLVSALKKIEQHSIIDTFNDNEIMAPMCIVSPLRIPISLFDTLSNLSSTHPPIKERIEALETMDGRGKI